MEYGITASQKICELTQCQLLTETSPPCTTSRDSCATCHERGRHSPHMCLNCHHLHTNLRSKQTNYVQSQLLHEASLQIEHISTHNILTMHYYGSACSSYSKQIQTNYNFTSHQHKRVWVGSVATCDLTCMSIAPGDFTILHVLPRQECYLPHEGMTFSTCMFHTASTFKTAECPRKTTKCEVNCSTRLHCKLNILQLTASSQRTTLDTNTHHTLEKTRTQQKTNTKLTKVYLILTQVGIVIYHHAMETYSNLPAI